MKKNYESLKGHIIGIVNFLKKELLTKEQQESHKNEKNAIIFVKKSENRYMKIKIS